jgi:protein SCO1/2
MPAPRTLLLYVTVAVVAGALGFGLANRNPAPTAPAQALVLNQPRPLPAFRLLDHRGESFGPERLQGQWTFLFFGFTHCPDICPTTLQTLAAALTALEDLPEDERPSVVMISVDPERDTPDQLAGYVPYFDPDFLGATGPEPSLQPLAAGLGVAYGQTPNEDGTSYTVDHTAAIFLVDPAGRLAAVFGTPHSAATIASDYRYVLEKAG